MSEMVKDVLNQTKFIVFQLADKEYAIPVNQVRSIEKLQHITRVPGTVDFVEGVINLRGVVTPIVDMRKRFLLPEAAYTESTRIIIVAFNEMEVGFIVDAANDVLDLSADSIEPQPDVVGAIEAEYISSVAKLEKRLLILVHLEKVLNPID
ncbi:chemotaxis protein CheW [Falsibacillus albus]